MQNIIHVCTLTLLFFNLGWGLYLIAVTYKLSPSLLGFSIVATLVAALAILMFIAFIINPKK